MIFGPKTLRKNSLTVKWCRRLRDFWPKNIAQKLLNCYKMYKVAWFLVNKTYTKVFTPYTNKDVQCLFYLFAFGQSVAPSMSQSIQVVFLIRI